MAYIELVAHMQSGLVTGVMCAGPMAVVQETYQGPTAFLPIWLVATSACRMALGEPVGPGLTTRRRGWVYTMVRGSAEATTRAPCRLQVQYKHARAQDGWAGQPNFRGGAAQHKRCWRVADLHHQLVSLCAELVHCWSTVSRLLETA
jgi:hypothetical protein